MRLELRTEKSFDTRIRSMPVLLYCNRQCEADAAAGAGILRRRKEKETLKTQSSQ